jgi:uncharacterized protein (DUF433 family)
MTPPSKTWTYLERDPKSAYKQLSIKGRRIRARILYGLFVSDEEPMTVEQIASEYALPLEAVKEAITYCESDPPELHEDYERERRSMEALGINDPNYKYHGQPKLLTAQEIVKLTRS